LLDPSVTDTLGQTWQHTADVTATAEGTFTDAFGLPTYFVSNHDVTATGPVSELPFDTRRSADGAEPSRAPPERSAASA
jgi:hypothetical protein